MKTKIDIVCGFMESGKTTLVNHLVDYALSKDESTLVVQYEKGNTPLDRKNLRNNNLHFAEPKAKTPDAEALAALIQRYAPKRLIVEYNGTWELEPFIKLLESSAMRRLAYVNSISGVADGGTLPVYLKNLGSFFREPLEKSDYLFLTNTAPLTAEKRKESLSLLKQLNGDAGLTEVASREHWAQTVHAPQYGSTQGFRLALDNVVSFSLFYAVILAIILIGTLSIMDSISGQIYMGKASAFVTVFASILFQAFPFILIGVFVSAIIQVFVSESLITRFFPKHPQLAMGLAVFAGVLFPVCDCAIIPVMRRLIQKGIPISAAVTFMLAAPIVDPVVIASTLYAFPGQPEIAIWRLLLGVTIALSVGHFFLFIPYKNKVLSDRLVFNTCQCGFCGVGENGNSNSFFKKILGVVRHASTEFFFVGQYLIIAAAFSTYIQTSVSPQTMQIFSNNPAGAILTMMLFAFILSICSTSDAFIARNFVQQFSNGPVVSFMVFGAMLDIKNLLLLLGSFQKKFVFTLIVLVIIVSFIILYFADSVYL